MLSCKVGVGLGMDYSNCASRFHSQFFFIESLAFPQHIENLMYWLNIWSDKNVSISPLLSLTKTIKNSRPNNNLTINLTYRMKYNK